MAAPPVKPSLSMRLASAFMRRSGVKGILSEVARTEADMRRSRATGPAALPRSVRRACDIRWSAVEGLPVAVVTPKRAKSAVRPLVYLHGGGYVNPIIAHHWRLIAALATENAWSVTVPMYRLAPEGDVTEALTRLATVHQAVHRDTRYAPVLGGDSAGGGLALALALHLRDQGLPGPLHLALFSPWLDVSLDNPDIAPIEDIDPSLALPGLRHAGVLWAHGRDVREVAVSPLHGDFANLCPTTVFIGTHDILLPDCRQFAAKARAAGADVALYEFPQAFHVFVAGTFLPESRMARRLLSQRTAVAR